MSKQRPNPDKITNELAGSSAFFRKSPPVATSLSATEPDSNTISETEAPVPPVENRTPVRPVRPARRQMIRHPFELYLDQLDQLRELAEAQKRQGDLGSMSRMVRNALDRFLDESQFPR